MSPMAPSDRKRIPLMAAGVVAALGFAIFNVQRAFQPPLQSIRPIGSLDRVSDELQRTLPLPSGAEAPAPTPNEAVAPGMKPATATAISEENLAPAANPFVPLPGQGQFGEQYVTAATPHYEAIPSLPEPGYVAGPTTPMRLATATMSLRPRTPKRAAHHPTVSIRSNAPEVAVGPQAPVLPSVPPQPAARPAPVEPAKPETPPTLVGTLLGDQPSAVFQLDGNVVIVPAGGMVAGWQLLTVDHGQAMLKHVASGIKVPVLVAAEATTGMN